MNRSSKPRGGIAVFFAVGLTFILAVAALTVDLGGFFVARNAMQNAADAGALAGSQRIYTQETGPHWDVSANTALATTQRNVSSTPATPQILVSVGYWNADAYPITGSLMSPSLDPGERDFPAVEVRVQRMRSAGNGFPTFFGRIFAADQIDIATRAVAVLSGPGYLDQRSLFPFVVTECLYEKYWDYTRSPPGPKLDAVTGAPVVFTISSKSESTSTCDGRDAMAWTGLGVGSNANAVKTIVERYKTVTPIASKRYAIGDGLPVFGSAASPFKEVSECAAVGGDGRCALVIVPVVVNIPPNASGELRDIVAFSCLSIIDAQNTASEKYVKAQMTTSCAPPPDSGGIGPIFGVFTSSALVQ